MELSIFLYIAFWQLFELFIWLLGAFLIGLYFGKTIPKRKKIKSENQHIKKEKLKTLETKSKIRATKKIEHGGKQLVYSIPDKDQDKDLNFDRIAAATIENKDD